ncbi:MAG: hypothetical protein IIA19_07305 [Thaumarchaeota archaeon]|nr:hypothetical protein [Nitrososphaerota archaeon]
MTKALTVNKMEKEIPKNYETRIMNRGTKLLYRESCPPKSAGLLFQKCQEKSLAILPQGTILSTKRGTSSMKVSDYPKVDNKLPNWGFITIARGTSAYRKYFQ